MCEGLKNLEGVGGGLGGEGWRGADRKALSTISWFLPLQPAQTWESGSRCPSFERNFLVTLSPPASHHFPNLPPGFAHVVPSRGRQPGNSCSWTTYCVLHTWASGSCRIPIRWWGMIIIPILQMGTLRLREGKWLIQDHQPGSSRARTAIQTLCIGPIPQMLVKNSLQGPPCPSG